MTFFFFFLKTRPTVRLLQPGLALQLLQQTLRPPERLGTWQSSLQVPHQSVETGVVRGLLEVLWTLVQPGSQDGSQGTVRTEDL